MSVVAIQAAEFERTLVFTPLPMKDEKKSIEDFLPLTKYLAKQLGVSVDFDFKKEYESVLEEFRNEKTDLAYLGPLPLAILKSRYPHMQPIISFRQKNGSTDYRCALSKFVDDRKPVDRPLKVALTQPLSTCGYYMIRELVATHYGVDLSQQRYHYTMSHTGALMQTLEGNFDVAGSSEAIAEKFTSVGMQIIGRSEKLPGFALVANTETLSDQQIETIRKTILAIPPEIYRHWGDKLKYGFERANVESYERIKIDYAIPEKGNMP